MIKVENENVEVRGIALDVIGEFQALCEHLNKELGEKDFAFVLGTIAGKFYKKRIAELEELKAPKTTYGDLVAGDTFKFKGHEFTKLRDGRAIINDYDDDFMDCPFDNVDNNYDRSLIWSYINGRFLSLLGFDEITDFVKHPNSCELLSEEEYEENKDLIKDFDCDWWLGFSNSSNPNYTNFVRTDGLTDCYSDVNLFNGVRPAFNFADSIRVQVLDNEEC